MTTPDTTDDVPQLGDDGEDLDIGEFIDALTKAPESTAVAGAAEPVAAGTFAMYPDGTGGIHMVMDIRQSTVFPPGIHRGRIPPGIIRAVGKLGGLRVPWRKRKA